MEQRDLYDINRALTGKTIFKGDSIPDNNYIVVVLVFIQNSEGKFLIQKRSEIKSKTASMYQYYSYDEEKQYGVVGIKIYLISSGFRYTYNKLVRDKIPEDIDSEPGRKSKYRILDDKEYLNELNKKVIAL